MCKSNKASERDPATNESREHQRDHCHRRTWILFCAATDVPHRVHLLSVPVVPSSSSSLFVPPTPPRATLSTLSLYPHTLVTHCTRAVYTPPTALLGDFFLFFFFYVMALHNPTPFLPPSFHPNPFLLLFFFFYIFCFIDGLGCWKKKIITFFFLNILIRGFRRHFFFARC